RRAAQNVICRLFARHHRWTVEIAVGDAWEDRTVGYPQTLHADHARLRIHHRKGIVGATHAAGAAGVISAFHMLANKGVELFVALDLRTRRDFAAAVRLERVLPEDFA